MPCLLALVALITPRLVIILLWLFSGWFSGIFDRALWPVLGFLFLPTTMLWYTVVQHVFQGVWTTLAIIGLVVALAIDVSPASSRRR